MTAFGWPLHRCECVARGPPEDPRRPFSRGVRGGGSWAGECVFGKGLGVGAAPGRGERWRG